MQHRTIIRFALLGALLATSTAVAVPAYAQKDARRTGSSAKEDRNQGTSKSNKDSRGSSGSNKSEGRENGKSRKERR
jgi:hypothetical protein